MENGPNTEKSPGDLMGLAVTQTLVKDHQLALMCNNNKKKNKNKKNEKKKKKISLRNYSLVFLLKKCYAPSYILDVTI